MSHKSIFYIPDATHAIMYLITVFCNAIDCHPSDIQEYENINSKVMAMVMILHHYCFVG